MQLIYKTIYMEKQFSEKESLELINQMINSAKHNLQKGKGRFFLLWGYLISGIALVNLLLLLILPSRIGHYAYNIWIITPLGLLPHYLIARRMAMNSIVKTYVETIMNKVWLAFGISIGVLMVSMLLASFQRFGGGEVPNVLNWIHWNFLIPFMLILYGFALFISGNAYRFKPLVNGAFICWISTVVIFILYKSIYFMEFTLVALIVSLICGYIIPGHIMNNEEQQNV